jgi:hypothetical protein
LWESEPVDVLTGPLLVSCLTKVVDSAAGEVGKSLWSALTSLLARLRGRSSDAAEDVDEKVPAGGSEITQLARRLLESAADDAEFAAGLHAWTADVQQRYPGGVTNTVSGSVDGNVVQAHDISAPITFN